METKTETIEVQEVSIIETALAEKNVTKQVIGKLKADYMGLKINGIEDKEGYKKVDAARKEAKKLRCLAVDICEAGRAKSIREQKEWIEKQKEVTGEISEVEKYLEGVQNAIDEEEKRILFEAAQLAKLPFRKDKLMTIGIEVEDSELLKINDDQFNALFNDLHTKHLEEKAALLKAEQDKLEAIKRADAEREEKRLAEERRKKELAEAEEKARKDAEAKLKEEMERKEREAKAAVEKAEREKAEAERKAKEAASKAEAEKQAALIKAEEDKKAAIAEIERKQREKEAAELKAKQEAEEKAEAERLAAIETELSKGDIDKFADLIVSLTALKTKYIFKSKKFQKKAQRVYILIDKINEDATK